MRIKCFGAAVMDTSIKNHFIIGDLKDGVLEHWFEPYFYDMNAGKWKFAIDNLILEYKETGIKEVASFCTTFTDCYQKGDGSPFLTSSPVCFCLLDSSEKHQTIIPLGQKPFIQISNKRTCHQFFFANPHTKERRAIKGTIYMTILFQRYE